MRLYLCIFIIISNLVNGQSIEWITFEQALKAQEENPKKILMVFILIGVVHVSLWIKKLFKILMLLLM